MGVWILPPSVVRVVKISVTCIGAGASYFPSMADNMRLVTIHSVWQDLFHYVTQF